MPPVMRDEDPAGVLRRDDRVGGQMIDAGYASQVECAGLGDRIGLPRGTAVRGVDDHAMLAARPDGAILRDANAAHLKGEQVNEEYHR